MRPLRATKLPNQAVGAVQSVRHSVQVSPIESKTSRTSVTGSAGETPVGGILTGEIEGAPARMRVGPVLALHR